MHRRWALLHCRLPFSKKNIFYIATKKACQGLPLTVAPIAVQVLRMAGLNLDACIAHIMDSSSIPKVTAFMFLLTSLGLRSRLLPS